MTERTRVGLTTLEATVAGPSGERITIDFLVDSGAKYTLLPAHAWQRLGLARMRTERFRLADLTTIERGVSHCWIELPEIDGQRLAGPTTVILGEEADVALIGVVTLESFGLVLNPLERSIHKASVAPLMPLTV